MKRLKFTMAATPTEIKDNWKIGIYGSQEDVDNTGNWSEGPRRERLISQIVDQMFAMNDAEYLKDAHEKSIFKGLGTPIPANAKKIMETSFVVQMSKDKKGIKVKRGDFQRFAFEKGWTGLVPVMNTFTDNQFKLMRMCEKIPLDKDEDEKIGSFMEECGRKGIDPMAGATPDMNYEQLFGVIRSNMEKSAKS